jgi:hypothetical protein
MQLRGKFGPPVGALLGLVFGAWVAMAEMPGVSLGVRAAITLGGGVMGVLAGCIVWWIDRLQSRAALQAAKQDDNSNCCAKCGRRNSPEASTCIRCGAALATG